MSDPSMGVMPFARFDRIIQGDVIALVLFGRIEVMSREVWK